MQSVETSAAAQNRGLWSKLAMFGMVLLLIVAVIFAANENDVIGWLVVIIAAGWLVLSIITVIMVNRGTKAVKAQAQRFNAAVADRSGASVQVAESADPMRDTKLDHSFKIIEVQVRVITKEYAKDTPDQEMIDRALDTIEMTAHNGRDMIDPDRHDKPKDSEGPISGEVI